VGQVDQPLSYSEATRQWLANFWQAEKIDLAYRETLSAVLSRMWPSAAEGQEQGGKASLLTLPANCCAAFGKDPGKALEVNAAWSLIYAAFYLLDKVEDQEAAGELFSPDPGVVTNVTTGFILSAGLILYKLETAQKLSNLAISSLQIALHRRALSVCAGQHLDLTQREPDLRQVWHSVTAKSGEFFSLGCLAGALVATNAPDQIEGFATFGRHLGVLIQIANDAGGLWGKGESQSDLARGKLTLPVAYAFSVLAAEKAERLSRLLPLAKDNVDAESEARSLILGCGGLVYLMLEAERHRQRARAALESLNLRTDDARELLILLDQIGRPMDKTARRTRRVRQN
jgi:geranylgeranyl pyrophosphate synthase